MGPGSRPGRREMVAAAGNKRYYPTIVYSMDRMASFSREQLTTLIRGISVRQVRLACGVVMFAYLTSHFLNHALGNVSMEALADGVYFHVAFWQFLPVAIVFYAA